MIHSNPKILPGKIIHQLENIAPEPTETKYDLNCRCNDGSTLRSPHCPQEFLHVSNKSLSLKLVSKDTETRVMTRAQLLCGTSRGSASLLYRPAKMMEMVGATKIYEPPITTGRRVPKNVCNRVFMPATNNIV